MSEVANAGNQPECIAETPTSSSEMRAAAAAKALKARMPRAPIPVASPARRATIAAAPAKAA